MRQQYYSTAAYLSLRQFFNKNLPSKRALQLWYTSIDGTPGICEGAIDIIREKAENYLAENGHPIHLTLIWDGVHIRKGIVFSQEKKTFVGFSTYTNTANREADEKSLFPKIATEALVFLVAGTDFKIPIAYELCRGLDGIDGAALALQVIKKIEAVGARIISFTGDGLPANIATYEELGARFDLEQPYFHSPTYPQQKIYIILDPIHMLKLARKHFSSKMIYHNDKLVDWDLLDTLVQKQSLDNFNLCNKLTTQHINWHQKPMNVRLAAETLSNRVANTLRQLRKDGYDEFRNSETTEEFCRMFNNSFDIQNFGCSRADDKYKQRICNETADHIFEFAERMKQYIKELQYKTKTTTKPILQSSVYVGFFGFYFNFISLRGIYEDFVLNGPLNEFIAFQFSQDHLETFFSLIRYEHLFEILKILTILIMIISFQFRNSLGRNDNPNAIEFASAFKKLLICHPVLTSVDNNVITNATGILTVSSRIQKNSSAIQILEPEFQLELDQESLNYEMLMLNEIENMDPYEQHMCAYIASCIEKKFIQNTNLHKYKCKECANVLLAASDTINDDLLAMSPEENKQPSANTLKIVIFCNAIMKLISAESQLGNSFSSVSRIIGENIDIDDLFVDVNFIHKEKELPTAHKIEFVTMLIETYMILKSHKIGKKISDKERGELIRHLRKRSVIETGQ